MTKLQPRLHEWRAESGGQRLQAPGNLGRLGPARRLIHGSLQTAMPLAHLVEAKPLGMGKPWEIYAKTMGNL